VRDQPLPPLHPARGHWSHDPSTVGSSSEQDPNTSDEPNVVHDRLHLVLTRGELIDVARALRQTGKRALAERLELILRLSSS
jgi:hypothetical protein